MTAVSDSSGGAHCTFIMSIQNVQLAYRQSGCMFVAAFQILQNTFHSIQNALQHLQNA